MEEKGGIGESRRLAMGTAWDGTAWCTGPRVAVSMGVWQGCISSRGRPASMDGWTSAGWKGEEELAAAPRRTEDGGKVSQLFPPLLMVVVLLHAEQQQLKHSARAPEFMGNQPIENRKTTQGEGSSGCCVPTAQQH